MWNFSRIGPKTKKLWLSIVQVQRPPEQPGLGPPPRRCELQLFLAGIRQAVRRLKAIHLGRLNMQFPQDCPKDKKLQVFQFFLAENLEKFRSTEHYGAPLEGSTIFLCRSSLGSTAVESCRLPELKYAIFSRTGRKTKKLPRSKLFPSMAFKHGLLKGSTLLFQYSSMTRAPLESCQLGEWKYAISLG